ncbi:hypothetical protein EC968_009727 [Mortierella alpina]|nr:hypothetical protein EC968_009727 [Mortierella alpina]
MPDSQLPILTSSQEHYFKKYLLGILIKQELQLLQKFPHETLPNLGGPFDLQDKHADSTTPFLRYLFESIVVPFPFLTNSRGELWLKLQLFMEEWAKIDEAGNNGVELEELRRRKRLKEKGERAMVFMYSLAIKSVQQRAQEKVTSQNRVLAENDTAQLQLGAPATSSDPPGATQGVAGVIHGVRINVVGISIVREKRHVREHDHAEFLVSSTLADGTDYLVARRHSHFRRLYLSLREKYPQYEFPLPPARCSAKTTKAGWEKDRTSLRGYIHNLVKVAPEVISSELFVTFLTKDVVSLTPDMTRDIHARTALDEHRMEQQAKFNKEVGKKVEELDKHLRQVKADLLQPGGVSRLFSAFGRYENINDLPPLYQTIFEWGCMNFASTLYHVFTASDNATLNFMQMKRTHMLMPYRTMWGILKISNPMAVMKGILDLFLTQPFGRRSLMQRIISVNIHEEISEYKKDITLLEDLIGDQGLCDKIHNYVHAPKDVVSTIVSSDGAYDVRDLGLILDIVRSGDIQPPLSAAQIRRVLDSKEKLDHESERSHQRHQQDADFLSADPGYQTDDDHSESESSSMASSVSEDQQHKHPRLYHLSRKHLHRQRDSGQNEPDEQKVIQQLQQLLVTHLRIRDKEQMLGLVFQGVTGEIFKELISIFYEPLVKVYRSANVADSLMDAKDFVDELIKIVEQTDQDEDNTTDSQSGKEQSVSTLYLDLVKKHLPSFYKFVHSVHKQDDGLFRDLLEWIESIISFMRTGYAWTRTNYKTEEELQATIDLDGFIRSNVNTAQWEMLQQEAESLRLYFGEVKERKRERVRNIAGLNRAGQSSEAMQFFQAQERERERVAQELKGIGMQQEDVDELEMLNYETHGVFHDGDDGDEDEQEKSKVPPVPIIDTLQDSFVKLIDRVLFQSARE